jgi:outer membrane protein TolC
VVLDNAMGLGPDAPEYRLVSVPPPAAAIEPLDAYLGRAFRQRPDLEMLEDDARAAGAEIAEYRSDYWPTIGAGAGYSVRGQDATPANNFDVGMLISWPLFNGFLTDHEIAETRLRQDAIRHGIEDLRQQIVLQVKSAYLDLQASLQRIERANRARSASEAELDLATKRYEAGLGNILELADAQRRFTEDGAEVVRAQTMSSTTEAALARATADARPHS